MLLSPSWFAICTFLIMFFIAVSSQCHVVEILADVRFCMWRYMVFLDGGLNTVLYCGVPYLNLEY